MAKKQRSALSSSMAGLILSPQAKISHAFERMQGALAIPNALRWATRSDPAIMERELARQGLDMVNELASMPDTRELFSPLSPSAPDSPEQFAAQMARSNMRLYHAAVDAASLIFTHSILDTAALELCDASIALDPEAWRACVRNAQFDLRDLETMGAGPLWERALRKYLESLAHKSLMEKIDK